jgi:nucleotide-binding universal stress UspA family protein
MILPAVTIKKILYATDLSESARHAFAYAVSLATRYEAGITMLHVIAEEPNLETMVRRHISEPQWEEIKKRNEDEARAALIGKMSPRGIISEALEQFRKEVEAKSVRFRTDEILVVRGNPEEQILTQAKEKNCDLIVMGTYGTSTLTDAMIGSTARRVVRRSPIPVLVIRLSE